jgi:hypothetical protein
MTLRLDPERPVITIMTGVAGRSASQDPDGRMNDRAKSFNANF